MPIIGVIPLYNDKAKCLWMLPGCFDGILESGGVPLMLPYTDNLDVLRKCSDVCDGFLFTGGQDVSPALYNQEPVNEKASVCSIRDRMELTLLDIAKQSDKPVLGICRGIQLINAAHGGNLYQDITAEYPTKIIHNQQPPYNVPVHKVKIVKESPLYSLLGLDEIDVNSFHHQAVKELAEELKVMAISEDGLIEAVYHPGYRFLWAVQWHPDFLLKSDKVSKSIFQAFIDSCVKLR